MDGDQSGAWLSFASAVESCRNDKVLSYRKWDEDVIYALADRYGIPLAISGELVESSALETCAKAGYLWKNSLCINELRLSQLISADLLPKLQQLNSHGRLAEWGDVLAHPWCPLLGPLPVPLGEDKTSPVFRAVDYIKEARNLIDPLADVVPIIEDPEFTAKKVRCPQTTDAFIKAARCLLNEGFSSVLDHALRPHYYGVGPGSLPEDLDRLPDLEVLESFARRYMACGFVGKRVRMAARDAAPEKVFALLAICCAWSACKCALDGDDNKAADGWNLQASGLLLHGNELRRDASDQMISEAETNLLDARKQLQEALPDAEAGRRERERRRVFGKKCGSSQTKTREIEWERWNECAQGIVSDREKKGLPALNKSELARRVKNDLSLTETVRAVTRRLTVG